MRLKRNFIFAGIISNILQYGIPLSYIFYRYDIIKNEDAGKSITGWGLIGVAIIYFIFQNKIKEGLQSYDKRLGMVAQKGKWGMIFLVLTLFLAFASLWVNGMIWFLGTLAVSNLISLPVWGIYYRRKTEYDELKKLIIQKQREQKIKGVTI